MKHKKLAKQKRLALRSSKGFTLIEVVLVLAIGGLIFLLAFLAFQQVSVNRRDTQRRNDAGRILAELGNFIANGGNITGFATPGGDIYISNPSGSEDACNASSSDAFIANFTAVYMCKDEVFKSPTGGNYLVVGVGGIDVNTIIPNNVNEIFFINIGCDNESRKSTVRMRLEKGELCRES